MTRTQLLLQQMDYTYSEGGWYKALQAALAGLTPAQAAWSPAPAVNSIWQTVDHLAFWKGLIAGRVNGAPLTRERIANAATFGAQERATDDATAWKLAVDRLHEAHAAYRTAVAGLTDAALDQPLPGEQTPLMEMLRALNVHDGYHLGQIVLLRKLQGAWPPPAQ